jgi:hypothetical protein
MSHVVFDGHRVLMDQHIRIYGEIRDTWVSDESVKDMIGKSVASLTRNIRDLKWLALWAPMMTPSNVGRFPRGFIPWQGIPFRLAMFMGSNRNDIPCLNIALGALGGYLDAA